MASLRRQCYTRPVPAGAELITRNGKPAARFAGADGKPVVGVLTADGQLRTCLFSLAEHDLKAPLRDGASDAELGRIIATAVWNKERGHRINESDFQQPQRTMSCIGG